MHSYLSFTDLPLTDIEINGQNLQQRTHLVYISIITHWNFKILNYFIYIYLQCTGILHCQIV